ncbi:hypothetical protein KC363_g3299 [Hortaea werneckii]|nr:hypothetical protein KC325_g6383 [Hortaea werneckii]KAI6990267.1 hypothetical protein KC359_g6770 [Hortaea werneckii]KAI7143250.1 hypothetical protein KC344_g6458 [Hortaea werneckii]KAI7171230.1 hypothetical protein KC360_g6256 [Hortaea werneckii]KAI7192404.1 hypothetical protein KC363_g3299 [Hortaea werneckii]
MTIDRRKRLYKSGAGALRKSRRYQMSTDNSVSELAFQHLVRVAVEGFLNDTQFQDYPMGALQKAAEAYIAHIFETAKLIALHVKHTKVQREDLRFVFSFLRSWGVIR